MGRKTVLDASCALDAAVHHTSPALKTLPCNAFQGHTRFRISLPVPPFLITAFYMYSPKLFRSFDINNDHCLEHNEFQQGMLMMGLKAAEDPYAFSKLVEAIDVDKTGEIDEEEFTIFFKKHK